MSPLSNILVLDMSRILAGPWAGQLLADFGADVIKIERPGSGDDTRSWGPPFVKDESGAETADSSYYLAANRGKKSITIDITKPEGQTLIRELVKKSDVLLENYKVGGLKKYGLDYTSLSKINSGLVYCSITGFGQNGPLSHRPGYDFMIQGMGGLMSVTGEQDDTPGGGPQKVGVAVSDLLTGLYAANAIQAALIHRQNTGEGQYIDMALLDVQVACLANMATNYFVSGQAPRRWGNAHPNLSPYEVFPTEDGHIVVAVGNDQQFKRLSQTLRHPEWATDERFARNPARVRNRNVLIPLIRKVLSERSSENWLEVFEQNEIPCGPINTLDEVFENVQIKHRGMQIELEYENAGPMPLVANPVKFSKTKIKYRQAPPLLGQHTNEVLGDVLGLSDEEIQTLRTNEVV